MKKASRRRLQHFAHDYADFKAPALEACSLQLFLKLPSLKTDQDMATDFEERRRKTKIFLHSVYDYSMGVLWLCAGGFFLLYKKFGIDLNIDSVLTTIFGIAAVLYGAFRIYRGYRKNY